MGTNQFTILREAEGTRRLLHRTWTEPHYALTMLAGPLAMLADAEHAEPSEDPLTAHAVAVLDPQARRGAVMASLALDDDPQEVDDAEQAIATGIWAAFGWTLTHVRNLESEWPEPWPTARRLRPLSAEAARTYLARVGDWYPVHRGVPSTAEVAPLSEALAAHALRVREVDGLPILVPGSAVPTTPRQLVLAVGCAVAAGYLALPAWQLTGDGEAWARPEPPTELDWDLLLTDPSALAAALVEPAGMSADALLEELAEAVRIGLDDLGRDAGADPFAALAAAPAEAQAAVIAGTRRLFADAGMA